MVDSFIQLVSESQQVNEMGLKNLHLLTNSGLGKTKAYVRALKKLKIALSKLAGTDIQMKQNPNGNRYYYPMLPAEIVQLMKDVYEINQYKATNNVGKWLDLYPNDYSNTIYLKTNDASSYQRSHFPNDGIPTALRGVGLGGKLYRALVKKVGYISSTDQDGTAEKDYAWSSILEFKGNPDGTPSAEDVHGISGEHNWMAIDRTFPEEEKLNVARQFIEHKIKFENTQARKFDIDDELISLLSNDFLSNLDRSYLTALVESERITRERFAEITRIADRIRQRYEETTRETERQRETQANVALQNRLLQFGVVDEAATWKVGDYIVVRQYLYNTTYTGLPIRKVVHKDINNGTTYYVAILIADAIRLESESVALSSINDTRTTSIPTAWVKVDITRIPNLDRVNLSDAEKEYVKNEIREIQRLERKPGGRAATSQEEFHTLTPVEPEPTTAQHTVDTPVWRRFHIDAGWVPTTSIELRRNIEARPDSDSYRLLKEFRDRSFFSNMTFVVLHEDYGLRRRSHAIPVFVPWVGNVRRRGQHSMIRPVTNLQELMLPGSHLTNSVTGMEVGANYEQYTRRGFYAYPVSLATLEDKLNARVGEYFYIGGHQTQFGLIAKGLYGAVNTSQQKFIYLDVYGRGMRSVSVRLDLLMKVHYHARMEL